MLRDRVMAGLHRSLRQKVPPKGRERQQEAPERGEGHTEGGGIGRCQERHCAAGQEGDVVEVDGSRMIRRKNRTIRMIARRRSRIHAIVFAPGQNSPHAIEGRKPPRHIRQITTVRGHAKPLSHWNIWHIMPELKLRLHCDLLLFGRVRRIKPVLPQRLKTRTFRPTGKSTLAIAANVQDWSRDYW